MSRKLHDSVHQRGRAFRRHAAPCRGIISQTVFFHTRRGSRPGQRFGKAAFRRYGRTCPPARAWIGFLWPPEVPSAPRRCCSCRWRRWRFQACSRCMVWLTPSQDAEGSCAPPVPVVFVAGPARLRLRVFLQVHLRHHLAAGVLHLQAPPVVHPPGRASRCRKVFAIGSFRNGESAAGVVPVRRGALGGLTLWLSFRGLVQTAADRAPGAPDDRTPRIEPDCFCTGTKVPLAVNRTEE